MRECTSRACTDGITATLRADTCGRVSTGPSLDTPRGSRDALHMGGVAAPAMWPRVHNRRPGAGRARHLRHCLLSTGLVVGAARQAEQIDFCETVLAASAVAHALHCAS